jgi:hypothetical protein
MYVKGLSIEGLQGILNELNTSYKNNLKLVFKNSCKKGYLSFRIATKNSYEVGSKISYTGRHIPYASWYVYGEFIDKIFEKNPAAVIYTRNRRYVKNTWEWIDYNTGSIMQPYYASEAFV